ncbi:MAG: right-handed parallel beta-helix repeat-containing protein [Planctomycetota bacterium]
MHQLNRTRGLICFVCLATLFNFGAVQAAETATQDATPKVAADLPELIAEQLAAGQKQVVIPPGRYHVTPQNREHLRLKGLRDVEIIAHGAELICTETTRAITIEDCENLTIRGLTIDYDPLPFTQGRIVEHHGHQSFTIETLDGYASEGLLGRTKVAVFDAATDQLRSHTFFNSRIEPLGEGRYRVHRPKQFQSDLGEFEPRLGDIAVVTAEYAPGGSIPHAIMASNSRNLLFEDVTLYASNMFGFFERLCSGSIYRRCKVMLRPLADELVSREHPRVRSLNADAFHSKHADVGPQYLECVATHQSDDSFAINGDYHLVTGSEGTDLRVLAKLDSEFTVGPGDPVELVTYQGVRLPDATVVSVESDGAITADERAFLAEQNINERLKNTRGMLNTAYRVTLDRPVDLGRGSVLAATNRMGNGFRIDGCDLGHNRSRGVLVKASHGVIANNTIQACWGEGIMIAPEWWWLESGSSVDVTIENNTILDMRGIPIAVFALGGTGKIAPLGAHADIVVRGNQIKRSPFPAIYVTSTDGLTLADNALPSEPSRALLPWVLRRYNLPAKPAAVELIHTTRSK